jgi:hypothetical protein|tara:strand:- start:13186 stop:13503 length:318 start_codon:yes stop_codon:yes gene_type:complete
MTIKKIAFEYDTAQHARMIVRLRYDRLTQGNFFRGLVKLYVENDLDMMRAIEKIKLEKSTMGKKKRQNSKKEIEKGDRLMKDLGLSNSEKNFIYDLIEEDFEEQE